MFWGRSMWVAPGLPFSACLGEHQVQRLFAWDAEHDIHTLGFQAVYEDLCGGFLMDVPAESVWFLRLWSCSYRSKQKRQSRPDVGRSAFAGFIVLDFAAFHKGQFSQKETNKPLQT